MLLALLLLISDLTITASHRIGLAPLTTNIRLTIQPHESNREACFVYDGPEFSESCWAQLPDSPRIIQRQLRNLPSGKYLLTLTLRRNDGTELVASEKVCSLSPDFPIEDC